ncbi:MAG: extracellular solute-binding protein [Brachybacterium sp.]|nr:extracellular solute-binding protein [Brachybacterium sp.]
MYRSRRFVLSGGFAAAALTLTGCGVATDGAGGDSGAGAGASDGEVNGDITFQTWNLKGGFEEYFTQLISDFEEKYPEANVEWRDLPAEGYVDKLSADAAAGNLSDVVDMSPPAAYTLATAGMLVNLAEAVPEAEADYLPEAWEGMTFPRLEEGTYGFPWYLNTGPYFFNTELFEKCGLDPANLPTTYDELFDQGDVMAENCDDVTMIGHLPTIETLGEYGVQLMDEDAAEFTFNGPKAVELIRRFADLYEAGGFTDESLNNLLTGEVDAFKAGQVASMPGSAYTLTELKTTAKDVYESVEISPAIANTAPSMAIHTLVVNESSKNQATALAFAHFATNPANQMAFAKEASIFPSASGLLDDPYFTEEDSTDESRVRVETAKQVAEAKVWAPPMFPEASKTFLHDQVAQAVMGKKDPQDALDDAVQYANERIATTE